MCPHARVGHVDHRPRETWVATLAPQIAGLAVAAVGFGLTARGLWWE
jgi:hypothetical protein